jgi:hypothetical protein
MSRTLTSGMQTESEASLVRPFFLIDLEFTSGSIYLWSGHGDLSWNSNTYVGAGDILQLSAFEETTDLGAVGATVTLTGINSSLVTKARDENYQGRPIIIRLGAFDSSASIIADPVVVFTGFMDVMTIDEGAEFSTIQVSAENRLIQIERRNERRYTDSDHKIDFPNDKGFEFVTSIQEKEIVWGRTSNVSYNTDAAGGGGSDNGRHNHGKY